MVITTKDIFKLSLKRIVSADFAIKALLHNLIYGSLLNVIIKHHTKKKLKYNFNLLLLTNKNHFHLLNELSKMKKNKGIRKGQFFRNIQESIENDKEILSSLKKNIIAGGLFNRYLHLCKRYDHFINSHFKPIPFTVIEAHRKNTKKKYNPFATLQWIKELSHEEKGEIIELGKKNGIYFSSSQLENLLQNDIEKLRANPIEVEYCKRLAGFKGLFESTKATHQFFADNKIWKSKNDNHITESSMRGYWNREEIPAMIRIGDL